MAGLPVRGIFYSFMRLQTPFSIQLDYGSRFVESDGADIDQYILYGWYPASLLLLFYCGVYVLLLFCFQKYTEVLLVPFAGLPYMIRYNLSSPLRVIRPHWNSLSNGLARVP